MWSDHDDEDEVGTSMFSHTGGDPGSNGLTQVQRGQMGIFCKNFTSAENNLELQKMLNAECEISQI